VRVSLLPVLWKELTDNELFFVDSEHERGPCASSYPFHALDLELNKCSLSHVCPEDMKMIHTHSEKLMSAPAGNPEQRTSGIFPDDFGDLAGRMRGNGNQRP